MNLIESLYEDEDLSSDEGINAICEKIKNLNVSTWFEFIDPNWKESNQVPFVSHSFLISKRIQRMSAWKSC